MKRCIQIFVFLLISSTCTSQSPEPKIDSAWGVLNTRLQGRIQVARQMKAQLMKVKKMDRVLSVRLGVSATALSKCLDSIGSPGPAMVARAYANNRQLTQAISRILVIAERYPELKATRSFLELQSKLEGAETQIHQAARRYNDVCKTQGRAGLQFIAYDEDRAPQVSFD